MEQESLPPPPLVEGLPDIPPPPPIPERGEVLASPGDLAADPDGKLPFWKPGWGEIARRLGWSWLFVGPAVALIIGMMGLCVFRWWWFDLWFNFWEVWVLALVGVIGGLVGVIRHAIKGRGEPFCIHCGYNLDGLPEQHLCPECGRKYSFQLIRKYQQDPAWFEQCWKNERVMRKYGKPQGSG
jgi:hypothetical protein